AHRHARRALRRRGAAVEDRTAGGEADRDRHQWRRAGDPVRGRLPGREARGRPDARLDAARARGDPSGRGGGGQPRRPAGRRVPEIEADDGRAAAIIAAALSRGPGWLLPQETSALLDCYGIAQPRHAVVATADDAVALARRWRRPIALKGVADGLVHRSGAGA